MMNKGVLPLCTILWFGLLLCCSASVVPKPVNVTAAPSTPFVTIGQKSSFLVQINVSGSIPKVDPTASKPPVVPVELAIVLDRSGSMDGGKMEHAQAAIRNIIRALRPDDIVHLIAYDDVVDVVFKYGTALQASDLIKQVDELYPRSATNIYDALQTAYSVMSDAKKGRTRKVFLFSDGLVNAGQTDPSMFRSLVSKANTAQRIFTSAFGIGVDFDETLMKLIAEEGQGEFFFIASDADTERVVGVGLTNAQRTVAELVRIKVRTLNGATIEHSYGFDQGMLTNEGGRLGDIKAGGLVKLLLRLAYTAEDESVVPVLEYQLLYNEAGSELQETLTGTVEVKGTADEELAKDEDQQVIVYEELQIAAEMEALARAKLDEGDMEEAMNLQTSATSTYQKHAASSPEASVRWGRSQKAADELQTGGASAKAKLMMSSNAHLNIMYDSAEEEL